MNFLWTAAFLFLYLWISDGSRIFKTHSTSTNTSLTTVSPIHNPSLLLTTGKSHLIFPDVDHEDVQVFSNSSLTGQKFGQQVVFDDTPKNRYRKRYGWNDGNSYGGGSSAGSFAGASPGDGAFASAGGGAFASAGGGGYGFNRGKGGGKSHYNPSRNKYGGGGPLSYSPNRPNNGNNKGAGNKPNYGSSYVPPNTGSGGFGGVGTDLVVSEDSVRIVICEVTDKCSKFSHCASYSYDYLRSKDRCCAHVKQHKGMCCDGNYPDGSSQGINFGPYATDKVPVPEISEGSLRTAASKAYDYQTTYRNIESRLLELNIVVEKGTAAHGHLQFFQTTPAALGLARSNFLAVKTANYIQDTYFLTPAEAGTGLQGYDFGGTVFEKICPASPKCDRFAKYRTADGSCNNPSSPKLGQSSTPLIRLLPPDYADGIWAPRVRKDGSSLPSPRAITLALVPDANLPDPRYSHLLMQFGQFIDHDLSHVPIMRFADMNGIQCCGGNSQADIAPHPACFAIPIPPNDFVNRGQRCMNFVRSMTAPRLDCTFGHADQLNQLTHWLDGSQLYGSSFEQADSLREFSGGRLRFSRDQLGRDLLPEDLQDEEECANPGLGNGNTGHCFVAGDKRVNEQIGLTSMHTLFLREHNRIASELSNINPQWDDETTFQETRRIVVAEYQHIIYNEWLPIIIGRNYMEVFGILPLYDGYYAGYDSNVDASVSNAFTTAAFRMGHTLVQGVFSLNSNGGANVGRLVLRDFFNNPHLLREAGAMDAINKGLLTQPIQRFDNFVTTELRDHLFETANSPGMDLIALNIQRGRDHGLPSYNDYRDLCRLGKARDFGDLVPIIHPRKIAQLERIYGNVDDIDLFIGGIHETPLQGAVVGPTFACIIGDQFVRSKKGDLYFYDIGEQPHSFTKAQLHEIRSVSMSRILCDNSDEIRSIQPLAFHLPNGAYNPMLPCGSPAISRIDLRAWKE